MSHLLKLLFGDANPIKSRGEIDIQNGILTLSFDCDKPTALERVSTEHWGLVYHLALGLWLLLRCWGFVIQSPLFHYVGGEEEGEDAGFSFFLRGIIPPPRIANQLSFWLKEISKIFYIHLVMQCYTAVMVKVVIDQLSSLTIYLGG